MVLRVRKNIAPHLKSLMGPWIVGQCDVYPPAASAAKASFQAAFPPAKQSEAVAFCKEEVIAVCTLSFFYLHETHYNGHLNRKYLESVINSILFDFSTSVTIYWFSLQ